MKSRLIYVSLVPSWDFWVYIRVEMILVSKQIMQMNKHLVVMQRDEVALSSVRRHFNLPAASSIMCNSKHQAPHMRAQFQIKVFSSNNYATSDIYKCKRPIIDLLLLYCFTSTVNRYSHVGTVS